MVGAQHFPGETTDLERIGCFFLGCVEESWLHVARQVLTLGKDCIV